MRKVLAYDDVIVPSAASLPSNPIQVSTASTKLFIDITYDKGAEDGMLMSLEWQDKADDPWAIVSDFGGATSPGVNTVLNFVGRFNTAGTNRYLIPIPQRLIAQGEYRLSIIVDGKVAADGTVTAYLKTGEA